jgi:undecaprenyl-diphosphatase
MNWLESLVLGVLQGLTEFLPVSSSGHLELGKIFLSIETEGNLTFTVAVHGATVLSTIVVFWKDILVLLKELMKFEYNDGTKFILKILLSMIPVLFLGLFFRQNIESLFTGKSRLVGAMLLVTALLLTVANYSRQGRKNISYSNALFIGVAQAFAVIPGISRSGATIATGLMLQNNKEEVAKFSFLMVLIPIIGANILDLTSGTESYGGSIGVLPIVIGFISAFLAGLLACKWMVNLVKRGKLIYFALYCAVIGLIALVFG